VATARLQAAWAWLLALFGGRLWLLGLVGGAILIVAAAGVIWRDDIRRTLLDPKVPFQTYTPPPAPNYETAQAWALRPKNPRAWTSTDASSDVFFVHPTTYDGGDDWNGPIDDARANRLLNTVMLPNYAGPFVRVGRLFAPRYRQASLYSMLTLRDDAREARRFAYGDVQAAWRYYLAHYNRGRPVILVGVEQGGVLAARLLAEEIAPNAEVVRNLAGVYLIETAVPQAAYGPQAPVPACQGRSQARCVVAWAMAVEGDGERANDIRSRSVAFDAAGQLVNLGGPALCVNPLTGALGDARAPQRLNIGAANATGLEWGARPAFLQRQVWAQCDNGVLRVGRPRSTSLRPSGSWSDRLKAPGHNLFYADIEADAQARVKALLGQPDFTMPPAPIGGVINVRTAPIHRID
jgi:hypothetical protein